MTQPNPYEAPASTKVKHQPVDRAAHEAFAAAIKSIQPEKR